MRTLRDPTHAASQVEDAFVTGCYSGGEVTMEQYRLILPQVKTIWASQGATPGALDPAEMATFVHAEIERWGKVAKDANVRIE